MAPGTTPATADPLASVVIGTAGHIDHGKTTLVRALTGVDTDRLPEEKERGITIELGFAPLTLPSGRTAGIVDVPGHERFVKTMVAGAGGIDLALLVVAANEAVMPQTREHLAICRLLGIGTGLVALTKCDLATADELELAKDDVRDLVRGSFLDGAPIVPCSATTGQGLEDLKTALDQVAARAPLRDASGPARLPIDRVFPRRGFGVVVTGTLVSGTFAAGDEVELLPSGRRARIRGLQIHGQSVTVARAGTRLAVNLQGLETAEVGRWEWLCRAGELAPIREIDGRIELLGGCKKALGLRTRLHFHIGAAGAEALAVLLDATELRPGETALGRLRLDRPVVALPGDRFIVRADSALAPYGGTVGGGVVLRVAPGRYRRRQEAGARARQIEQSDGAGRAEAEIGWAGTEGLSLVEIRRRVAPAPEAAVAAALGAGRIVEVEPGRYLHRDALESLRGQIVELCLAHHKERPIEPGIGREELRTRLGGAPRERIFVAALDRALRAGEVAVEQDVVRAASHRTAGAAAAPSGLGARALGMLRSAALQPPRVKELADALRAPLSEMTATLKALAKEGRVVRVSEELYFDATAVSALRTKLTAYLDKNGQITAQQFKEMVGASRKFTIPLAEHFDAEKVTLRVGETRVLRGRKT